VQPPWISPVHFLLLFGALSVTPDNIFFFFVTSNLFFGGGGGRLENRKEADRVVWRPIQQQQLVLIV
jgi:hypothetical protein